MNYQLVITIGGIIASIGGAYAVIQWRLDRQDRDDEKLEYRMNKKIDEHIADDERTETSLKNQMSRMWEWKDAHERDAAGTRLELQKQIGKIEAGVQIHDGQYAQIISLISEIKDDIKELKKQ